MRQHVILCVDDEQNILNSLRRLFLDESYEILTATSGREALDILKEKPVDVIISDERMPEMTGVEFLSLTKNVYPDAVRIMLSGYAEPRAMENAINEGGIYKFIAKPWDDGDLQAAVRQSLELRRFIKEKGSGSEGPKGKAKIPI